MKNLQYSYVTLFNMLTSDADTVVDRVQLENVGRVIHCRPIYIGLYI